jgi:uncharacterized protein YhbP (UPF0306 family)
MKKGVQFIFFCLISLQLFAQNDTIKIGQLLISKPESKSNLSWEQIIKNKDLNGLKVNFKKSNNYFKQLETSWFAFDLALVNYLDETKYAENKSLSNPAIGEPLSKFKMQLNNGKSTNINIWIVQQKYRLKNPAFYLKYGLGLEMFNFRYEYGINFRKNESMFIYLSDESYEKNKLFTSYLSAPVQLGYDFKLKNDKILGISGGLVTGYLFKSYNKQINRELGKEKYKSNFSLRDMRLAGVFEIRIDKLKFFGTASLQNMLDKMNTNQSLYPYSFGLRFSKF